MRNVSLAFDRFFPRRRTSVEVLDSRARNSSARLAPVQAATRNGHSQVVRVCRKALWDDGFLFHERNLVARRTARPTPTAEQLLTLATTACVTCGHHLHLDYSNFRNVTTLAGVTRYTLRVGRCRHGPCDLYTVPFRP